MKDKEIFEKYWIANSGITKDAFDKDFITLPCNCGDDDCDGFGVYNRNPLSVKTYFDLYAPKDKLSKDELMFILATAKEYDKEHGGSFEHDVSSVIMLKQPDANLQ